MEEERQRKNKKKEQKGRRRGKEDEKGQERKNQGRRNGEEREDRGRAVSHFHSQYRSHTTLSARSDRRERNSATAASRREALKPSGPMNIRISETLSTFASLPSESVTARALTF